MSLHRRNPRRDSSEPGIVRALTALGCSVQPLSGRGVPDLLVCHRRTRTLLLIECKAPLGPRGGISGRDLTPDQETWAAKWPGDVWVARTAEEAVAAVMEAVKAPGRLLRATDDWDLVDVGGGSFGGSP